MSIRVAIVEDNDALRRSFVEQCTFYPDIRCVGDFGNAEAALKTLKSIPPAEAPEIILMDIELPGQSGIEATITIREILPESDILILTVFENEDRVFRAIRAGASGYLLKDEAFESIVEAIRDISQGGAPMSGAIARKVMGLIRSGEVTTGKSAPAPGPTEIELSAREREILEGLVRGETYATLAEKLIISPHTVRTHIKNIYKKLHVQSRAAAVRVALERGYL